MLSTHALCVHYGRRPVLQNIEFSLEPGQLVGLIGPNGAGKTTLLRALAHLIEYSGSICLNSTDTKTLSRDALARRMAYLAQGHTLHWPMQAYDVVALGRLPHRAGFIAGLTEADRHAIEQAMNLADCREFAQRRIDQLSGGERARVMLARALAVETPILLCDEPVASLDPYHQLHIMEMLRRHAETAGAIVICVLHDLTWAGRFCHRLLLLHKGYLVCQGEAAQVLSPEHLARVYQVSAITGVHENNCYLLPWECLH